MASIIEQLKYKYKNGDVMMRLIFINVAVFLLIQVIAVFCTLFNLSYEPLVEYVAVPSNLHRLITRLWTPITYMFVHETILHLLFNMLWLYWFGNIFLQYFTGRTLGSLYILGGLSGALLFLLAFNTIPYYVQMGNGVMIGASAAVMAIVMGAAFYRPEVRLNLFLFGSIQIIYIALFVFVIDFLSLSKSTNPGGHIAHIGGALAGYIFAVQYRNGHDITAWLSRLMDGFFNIFKPRQKRKRQKPEMKVTHRKPESDSDYNHRKHQEQEQIDAILDKLKQSGYNSLSSEEKKKLFDASKK